MTPTTTPRVAAPRAKPVISSSGFSGGDGGESGQGSVEVIGDRVLLSLRSTGGGLSQHSLQVQGNDTYVDGERAYRVQSNRCR